MRAIEGSAFGWGPLGGPERLSHRWGILRAMATTWRLKATRGSGWVQHVDRDGRCSVTADPQGARQWGTLEEAVAAKGKLRPGLVPVIPVEGPAFTHRAHGAPA